MDKNELIIFTSADNEVKLEVAVIDETVWLTQAQLTDLYQVDRTVITRHINNVFKDGELERESNVQKMHIANSDRPVQFYNLDVIISVGYRVKSQRGIEFRRWANRVLKDYIIKGYAINEKRLEVLQKTVDIQTRMLSSALEIEEEDVLQAVSQYTQALMLLDSYDHQTLEKPKGNASVYRITYAECRAMVDAMEDSFKSDVFGVEKETGKVEGILAAVYQHVFGTEVYPSAEEKAANLLYFMIKDHPYADGCKRIAASLFLEFLSRNHILMRDGQKIISNGALVAITLMIAQSNPQEKDIMVAMVMNLLTI